MYSDSWINHYQPNKCWSCHVFAKVKKTDRHHCFIYLIWSHFCNFLEFWYADKPYPNGRYNLNWLDAQTACETYLHTTVATYQEINTARLAGRYAKCTLVMGIKYGQTISGIFTRLGELKLRAYCGRVICLRKWSHPSALLKRGYVSPKGGANLPEGK